MKNISLFLLLFLPFVFTCCEYDNYDEPEATISGKVVYNGQTIYVKNNQVTFRLYEPGWELSASTYMNVQVAQDGTFNASVYSGKSYRLIRQENIGPWVNPSSSDTIFIENCKKNEVVEMQVTPYYLLANPTISNSGRIVSGSCTVQEIAGGRNIEYVGLYAGRNIIVDNAYNFGSATTVAVAGDQVSLQVDLSGLSVNSTASSFPSTGIFYARLGLKIEGIDAMIYTEPFRLSI